MGCCHSKEDDNATPKPLTRFERILSGSYDEIFEEDMYILHNGNLRDLTRQMTEEEARQTLKVLKTIGIDAAEWYIKNTLNYQVYGLCLEAFLVKKPREDADYTTSSYEDSIHDVPQPDVSDSVGNELDKNYETAEPSNISSSSEPAAPERVLRLEGIGKISVSELRKHFESLGRVETVTIGKPRNTAYLTYKNTSAYERCLSDEFHLVQGRVIQASPHHSAPASKARSTSTTGTFLTHPDTSTETFVVHNDSSRTITPSDNTFLIHSDTHRHSDVSTGTFVIHPDTRRSSSTSVGTFVIQPETPHSLRTAERTVHSNQHELHTPSPRHELYTVAESNEPRLLCEKASPVMICRFTQRNLASPYYCTTHHSFCHTNPE